MPENRHNYGLDTLLVQVPEYMGETTRAVVLLTVGIMGFDKLLIKYVTISLTSNGRQTSNEGNFILI